MRAGGWLTGLVVVAVVAGILTATNRPASTAGPLADSRQRNVAVISAFHDGQPDPPHVLPPPKPSPSPAPQPPATSSGGRSAPPRAPPPSIVVRTTGPALTNKAR